jgi:hypothetical protein
MTEDLIDVRLDDYMTRFGQAESIEITQRLKQAKLFSENLDIAVNNYSVPGAKALSGIIYSSHYKFLLANKRKIYFGSLFFLKVLCEKYRSVGMQIDELKLCESLLQVCEMHQ